jgi:hypothetical protein
MVYQFTPIYPHRLNADCTRDSICRVCHMTVASARNEDQLATHEHEHVCSSFRLDQLSEDQSAHYELA